MVMESAWLAHRPEGANSRTLEGVADLLQIEWFPCPDDADHLRLLIVRKCGRADVDTRREKRLDDRPADQYRDHIPGVPIGVDMRFGSANAIYSIS